MGRANSLEKQSGRSSRACRGCARSLRRRTGGVCGYCESVHCPFCGVASNFWRESTFSIHEDPCAHLVGSYCHDSGEWDWSSSLDELALPYLTEGSEEDWSEDQKAAAFGELAPFLDAYEAGRYAKGLTEPPDKAILLQRVAERVTVPTKVTWWCPRDFSMGSMGGVDYFAADAIRFESELNELMRRLEAAFECLR